MQFKFTDKEITEALKKLIIIVDTREKKNKSVLTWFEANKIDYKVQGVKHGDYTCVLPKGSLKGIDRDLDFSRKIVIEKKASIDELAGNFSKNDTPRLKSEFAHLQKNGTRCYIFIEDSLFHKHLRGGQYRSQYNSKQLYARLKGFEAEYNTIIVPVAADYIGSEIRNTLYYYARHFLMRELCINNIDTL